jgi:hypothetical protein
MKHFENLFPPSVQLYSYLRDFAFEYSGTGLAITKKVSFTLHNLDRLTVVCQGEEGVFFNVQIEASKLEPYLKVLKFYGFIISFNQVTFNTFEVVLWRTPKVAKAA